MVRIGIDLKIFDVLEANKQPLELDELAKFTGADPLLLRNAPDCPYSSNTF